MQRNRKWYAGLLAGAALAVLMAGLPVFAAAPVPPKPHLPNLPGMKVPEQTFQRPALTATQLETLHQQRLQRWYAGEDKAPSCAQSSKNEGLALFGFNYFPGTYWVGTNGNAVIFNNGYNLSFAKASDLSHPTVADYPILDNVYASQFVGNTAYLLESYAVDVWDVTDPANPAETNYLFDCSYSGQSWRDIAVSGHYAFLAAGTDGFYVMDLNGTGSVLGPFVNNNDSYSQVQVSGNYLLAYNTSGYVDVFDVSLLPNAPPAFVQQISIGGGYDKMIYSSPYFYMLNLGYGDNLDIYQVINVATDTPSWVGSTSSAFNGDYLTSATLNGNYLVASGYYGAYIVNVSTPSSPSLYRFFADSYQVYHDDNYGAFVAASGSTYVLADYAGVTGFDLTGARTGYYITTSYLWGWDYNNTEAISPDGTLALELAGYEGVVVLDTASLSRVGFYENPVNGMLVSGNWESSYLYSVAWSPDGTKAYVSFEDDTASMGSGVLILDMSDPTNPTLLGEYVPDPVNNQIYAYDAIPLGSSTNLVNRILVNEYNGITGDDQLEIVDVTDPANPVALGSPLTPGGSSGYYARCSVATGYTSGKTWLIIPGDYNNGSNWVASLWTMDITDPTAPAMGVTLDLSSWGYLAQMAVANANNHWFGYGAESGTFKGLIVVDLADPGSSTSTVVRGSYPTNSLYGVSFVPGASTGPQVVATDGSNGYLFDVSSPVTPSYLRGVSDPFGMPVQNIAATPDGSNSDLYLAGYYGVSAYLNVPDYTPPTWNNPNPTTITVTPPPAPGNVIKVPVQITATNAYDPDGASNILKVRFYAVDLCGNTTVLGDVTTPTAPGTYTLNFDPSTSPVSGQFTLAARVYDKGYNSATFYDGTIYTILPAPQVTITAPTAATCGLVGTVLIKGTASVSTGYITRAEVFVDGVSLGLATLSIPAGAPAEKWSVAWDTTSMSDGPHVITVEVMAQDTIPVATAWSTFATSSPLNVTVTNHGQPIYITSPSAGNVVGGTTVALSVNIASPSCVTKVGYYLDGAAVPFVTSTTAPFSATWDTTGVALGNHVLTAQATDVNGKVSTSPIVNLMVVSYTPPTLTATATPSTGNIPLSVAFAANVTGGIAPFTYAWTFGDGTTGSGQATTHSYTTAGTFNWSVTVTDGRGTTASANGSVTAVNPITPPSISGVSKAVNPFRLKVSGSNFQSGAVVKINGTAVTTVFKSGSLLVAKQCKSLCPKGTAVQVTVTNPDGGVSNAASFTR